MYSHRLYKNRDSYVLYIPIVHTFGSVNFTHTLFVQTHTHDVSAPWAMPVDALAMTSVLCLLHRPLRETVPSSVLCCTKNAYTSEITIFTL